MALALSAGTGHAFAQESEAGAEARSFQLVNISRTALGLRALVRRPELDVMARAQAGRMAARGDIYHNPNLGADATAAGLDWIRLGENVGVGPDVAVIHAAFLASPHHRDNMLFPAYNAIGVGIAPGVGNRSGMIFVAHVFGQLVGRQAVTRPAPAKAPSPPPAPPARPAVGVPAARPPVRSSVPNAVIGGVIDPSSLLPALA